MGSFSIYLDAGVENVRRLLAHAEEHSITDFGRLLTIYHRSTGLEEKLELARGYMRFEEYLDSPQAGRIAALPGNRRPSGRVGRRRNGGMIKYGGTYFPDYHACRQPCGWRYFDFGY